MFGIFKSLKRTMTGEVLATADTEIMGGVCTLSLRLKQDGDANRYVVLAALSGGNYQYYSIEAKEFEQFAEGVQQIRKGLHGVMPAVARAKSPDTFLDRALLKPNPLFGFAWFLLISALLFGAFVISNGALGHWYILLVFGIGSIPTALGWLYKRLKKPD